MKSKGYDKENQKILLLLIIIQITSCNDGQKLVEKKPILTSDTLYKLSDTVVVSSDLLIIESFFGGESISKFLINQIKEKPNVTIKLSKNNYDENTIDTLKTIEWRGSSFNTIFNKLIEEPLLVYASIIDTNIVFKNKVKVGQSAKEIFNRFNVDYNNDVDYKSLTINGNSDADVSIQFYFTNHFLTKILYIAYVD